MSETICYNEIQDWKGAVAFVLRRWLILALIIVAMAAVFGQMRIIQGPEALYTDAELENMQQQIIRNNSTIEKDEGNIIAQQNTLEQQQKTLDSYKSTLEELQRQLEKAEEDSIRLDLSNRINTTNSTIMSVQTQISSSEQAINNFNSEIVTLKSQNESYQEKLALSEQPLGKRELVKSAVIGGIAGIFLGVIILLLWYIFYGKLQRYWELEQVYGYDLLGSVYVPKRKIGLVYYLMNKWEGYSSKLDIEKEYDLIAARIELLNYGQEKAFAVTGTINIKYLEEVAGHLRRFLPEENYTLTAIPNPVHNPESIRDLKKYTVIVVEKRNISRKHEIIQLTKLLRTGNIKVQGAIGA
ncbi:MAG: hypothetical protein HFI38_10015 [Lachnospiraceae bacterium]|jgi:hypothetical protein|nr:hypothetical protein [Lachnospiraceae bacterium]